MLQKGPETEKKVWLRVGLNPQLRWLTSVCLRGFDRNVQQLFTVFPLHLAPSTRCNERTKAADVRLIRSSPVSMCVCNAK